MDYLKRLNKLIPLVHIPIQGHMTNSPLIHHLYLKEARAPISTTKIIKNF